METSHYYYCYCYSLALPSPGWTPLCLYHHRLDHPGLRRTSTAPQGLRHGAKPIALLIVCSCRKCYRCCLKTCHWRFDVTCGFNTMGRRRILVYRPNSTSTHSFLTGGYDVAALYHGLQDRRTWTLWTSSFGDTWKKLFTGIRRLTWKTWQQSFMLLWRPLMQTCYDVCKLVFHDVRLYVGECVVDSLIALLVTYLLSSVSASIVRFLSAVYPDICELCILFMCTNLLY
jgi:hypothetical protein